MAEWIRHRRWWGLERADSCELVPVIAGGTNIFAVTQRAFRLFEDGAETTSVAIAAENTNITRNLLADSTIQLRIGLQESGSGSVSGATSDDYQLQYSKNGGAFTNVTAASANVKGFNSSSLTDAATTTQRLSAGTGSFVAGELSEVGLVTDRQLTANNFTELLYSLTLVAADLVSTNTLDFRVLLNGAVMTYSVTPRITISKAYSLTADARSCVMSGTASTLKVARRLAVASVAYLLSGAAASLRKAYPLIAQGGAVVSTSTSAGLRAARALALAASVVLMVGISATLKTGHVLAAAAGSTTWTGANATLTYTPSGGSTLTADSGDYASHGTAASLLTAHRLTTESGAVLVSGSAAILNVGHVVPAAAGSIVQTGTAAGLIRTVPPLAAGSGSFLMSGQSATLRHSIRVSASSGPVTWTGTTATLIGPNAVYDLVADPGFFTWAGTSGNLQQGRRLTTTAGAVIASGQTVSFSLTHRLTMVGGITAWVGMAAALAASTENEVNWRICTVVSSALARTVHASAQRTVTSSSQTRTVI